MGQFDTNDIEVFYKNTKSYINEVTMNLILTFQMKMNSFRRTTIKELKMNIHRIRDVNKTEFETLVLQVKEHIKNLREVEVKVDEIELKAGFHFIEQQQLIQVAAQQTEETAYSCKICHRGFNAQGNYRSHMKTHHNIKNILQCPHCKEGFQRCQELAMHLLKLHSVAMGFKKLYRCPYTNQIFSNSNSLSTWVNSYPYYLNTTEVPDQM